MASTTKCRWSPPSCRCIPTIDPDIPSLIGASAAVALSGIPFNGPIGAARVGYKDGQYLLNPTAHRIGRLAAGPGGRGHRTGAVLMVESEAQGLSEEVMLGAVVFGHAQMQVAIGAIRELAAQAGKPRWAWTAPAANPELTAALATQAESCADQGLCDHRKAAASRPRGRGQGRRHRRAERRRESEVHRRRGGRSVLQAGKQHRPPAHPQWRAAHRRPRHQHRAAHHGQGRRAAAYPRFGAVHPR